MLFFTLIDNTHNYPPSLTQAMQYKAIPFQLKFEHFLLSVSSIEDFACFPA